jgi:hypothetical protein
LDKMVEGRSIREIEQEEYEEDLENSGLAEQGRSTVTGY